MPEPAAQPNLDRASGLVLVSAIFVLAICGLVYELVAGTLSSYLLGDSITQFSLVIGLFLTAMGFGSYLSKFLTKSLLPALIGLEIAVGLVGGMMALSCFAVFAYSDLYLPVLLGFVLGIGTLVGLEIPLVVRILREIESLRITLANVLSADYAGALVASLLFPFVLIPFLGVVRAGIAMGLLNTGVASIVLWRFTPFLGAAAKRLKGAAVTAAVALIAAFAVSGRLVSYLEEQLYSDEIVYTQDTPYQRIVLTRWHEDTRLYLNGHLQFSSVDEYRYHEALVHPAMGFATRREAVLLLGGGDGLAAREVAKYPDVKRIDLVDIDGAVTNLFASNPLLTKLNDNVFADPRLTVHSVDAMAFLRATPDFYDVIIIDLPDPSVPELGKLFSKTFYSLAGRHLAEGGTLSCQCTSPFRSRQAFWCAVHTIGASRCGSSPDSTFEVRPYHTIVPTFGTWGFAVAGANLPPTEHWRTNVSTKYLTRDLFPTLFVFPPDMAELDTPISSLDNPVICRLYRTGYHKYLE